MKRIVLFLSVSLIFSLGLAAVPAEGLDIQALIDGAGPGGIVRVPAGSYRVNLVLKAGVILEGEGAEVTVLDGGGVGPVIVADGGGVVKGFTITGGIEGVKASTAPIGVFENIITGNLGSGIRCGGGEAAVVNNLIYGNGGPAGIDVARAFVLAVNNSVCGGRIGLLFWKCPTSTAVNNLVAGCQVGLVRDDESEIEFYNNLLSGNLVALQPSDLPGENFRDQTAVAGCRLEEGSPFRESGVTVEGVSEGLTGGIGALLPAAFPLETYLEVMGGLSGTESGEDSLVEYELLGELGLFRVVTSFARPEFTIASSTASARIEDAVAYDRETQEKLVERVVPDAPPAVEVWGWGGVDYPSEADRYVMESVFTEPESYFASADGRLHFVRETNFPRIRVLIPEGCAVDSLAPEGEIDSETGVVSILNPARTVVEINLTLSTL